MTPRRHGTRGPGYPRRPRAAHAALVGAVVIAAVLAGCTDTDERMTPAPTTPAPSGTAAPAPSTSPPSTTATGTPPPTAADGPVRAVGTPTVIATGLTLPWSLVRMAAGSTLVSERDTATVKEISDDGIVRTVGTVPGVVPGGEGGLLGLAVLATGDPGAEGGPPGASSSTRSSTGATPPYLYAYTTTATDNRVIRMPLTGAPGSYGIDTAAVRVIIRGIPKAGNHNGGRIKFGPDGALYITAGDAGQRERAQEMSYLGGKILRVNPDGSIPADNPVADSPVYTLGHRNPQGIAWDDAGQLWAAEFGQDTWDEFNRIDKGANYGWPIVEGRSDDGRFRNPVHQWSTDEASPSGLLYTRGTFFLAALRGERLWRIVPSAGGTTADTSATLTGEFGRLRDVIEGADDTIWVITNNTGRSPRAGDDKVLQLRLAPALWPSTSSTVPRDHRRDTALLPHSTPPSGTSHASCTAGRIPRGRRIASSGGRFNTSETLGAGPHRVAPSRGLDLRVRQREDAGGTV